MKGLVYVGSSMTSHLTEASGLLRAWTGFRTRLTGGQQEVLAASTLAQTCCTKGHLQV